MRLTILLAAAPVVDSAAVLHWHWFKVQLIEHMAWQAIEKLLHALSLFVRRKAAGYAPVLPVVDSAAVLNLAMIVGGIASLLGAAAFPKARPALVACAVAGLAVGVSREIERRNRQRQPRLAA